MSRPTLDDRLVTLTAPASFEAEQYQGLRLKLEQLQRTRDVRTIGITSPGLGDGKTLTSINLAGALSLGAAARVLLIDADLRRPAVGRHLGLEAPDAPGLADLLREGRIELADAVHRVRETNLHVLLAGAVRSPVHTIFRSPALGRLLQRARALYDYVILDTPPVLPVFDAALLTEQVDGLLVVLSANKTPRKLLGEALNLLDAEKVLGIVLNRDRRPLFGYYGLRYRKYFLDPPGYTPAA